MFRLSRSGMYPCSYMASLLSISKQSQQAQTDIKVMKSINAIIL
jgi:hypothetical protein